MKKVLFASTAASALLIGGIASAQGIALFGSARMGLGYNVNNDGGLLLNDDGTGGADDLRAVSRVRFGVNMTGETDSGITFGGTIRADNAVGGNGGTNGMNEGSVFMSGNWGTLTMGDTNGADEQWVGDVPGDYSLTGLGNFDETPFISNGGGFGSDDSIQFANNPFARPTIRYDFDIAGFGLSLSSNRDLTDIVLGAGYSMDFGAGSFSIGAGYNKFDSFEVVNGTRTETVTVTDVNGDDVTILAPVTNAVQAPSGEQWSVGLKGTWEQFGFGATWTKIDGDEQFNPATNTDDTTEFQTLLFGGSMGFDAFAVGAYYAEVLNADGFATGRDGDRAYGFTGQYDLGGGATVNGGIGQVKGVSGLGEDDDAIVGDFGVSMAF